MVKITVLYPNIQGKKFDVDFDPANKSKGIGVGNIINRAELFNGSANFISQPDKGCLLSVTFPIESV